MRSVILILSILISLVSLKGYSQNDNEEILERLDSYLSINDSLKSICDEISILKQFNLNINNLEKSDSLDLKLYKRFMNNCVGYELYALTYHESPMVKMFSYCGLHESNKTLLMETMRNNINDTSTVCFSFIDYYDEIYGNRVSVIYITLVMTYWGYTDYLSITLNEKDIKYIRKEYEKKIKYYAKIFKPYEVTLVGKLKEVKFGHIIELDDSRYPRGNYYYIDKKDWKHEDYGKEVQVTGTVNVSCWFRRWREPNFGYSFYLAGPRYLIKTIEVKKIKIL